jgi:hypothetical protein
MVSDRRQARGVVLAEDKRTERFFRHLLQTLGYDKSRFRFQTPPAGTGAAEAWVRKRYPGEIKLLRSKNYQHDLCAIVVRDGDRLGIERRKEELDAELNHAGLGRREPDERIATPVPTWSIETWLLALLGQDEINEAKPFNEAFEHRYPTEKQALKEAARTWCDDPTTGESLASLRDGRLELARLDSP